MNGLLIPAIVTTIRSLKDGSISFTCETQEMSSRKVGELFNLRNKLIVAYLSEKETIPQKEIDQIDVLQPDMPGKKTQSQRLRAVLFRLFEQEPSGYTDFEQFYKARTDLIIEQIKAKLQ